MITQGELSWIRLMKQIQCLMIPWGAKYSEAINQSLVPSVHRKTEQRLAGLCTCLAVQAVAGLITCVP